MTIAGVTHGFGGGAFRRRGYFNRAERGMGNPIGFLSVFRTNIARTLPCNDNEHIQLKSTPLCAVLIHVYIRMYCRDHRRGVQTVIYVRTCARSPHRYNRGRVFIAPANDAAIPFCCCRAHRVLRDRLSFVSAFAIPLSCHVTRNTVSFAHWSGRVDRDHETLSIVGTCRFNVVNT